MTNEPDLVVHCKRSRYDVLIDRSTPFGNPFPMRDESERDAVIARFRDYLAGQPELVERIKRELPGKVLGCWCRPKKCHGDVLVEIANSPQVQP